MRQVADAWKDTKAADAWREGYYPLEDVVRLPDGAFHNKADKQAYLQRNFTLRGALPGGAARHGRIRWTSGESLAATVMTARQAYETLDSGDGGPGGDPLTVTKAVFGTMTLSTSRGPARVPAWRFTLDGYDTPLQHVAVSPSKPPRAPVESLSQSQDTGGLWPLHGLKSVAGDGRSVTVGAEHGSCDDGPAVDVLETGDSVVLAGRVRGANDGPCNSMLLVDPVTVKLDRPLGGRLLLDAFTGAPVTMAR
ncbi:hypothetical protein ACFWVC_07215 [Streptomyces sp. NPDC058691]|uniref:hypothetical protein n=1 Tax=Streptomyces sp. NPDC058691 TaxID=3346601 RepID=UPI00365F5DAA